MHLCREQQPVPLEDGRRLIDGLGYRRDLASKIQTRNLVQRLTPRRSDEKRLPTPRRLGRCRSSRDQFDPRAHDRRFLRDKANTASSRSNPMPRRVATCCMIQYRVFPDPANRSRIIDPKTSSAGRADAATSRRIRSASESRAQSTAVRPKIRTPPAYHVRGISPEWRRSPDRRSCRGRSAEPPAGRVAHRASRRAATTGHIASIPPGLSVRLATWQHRQRPPNDRPPGRAF
jgi:hypothetical protein